MTARCLEPTSDNIAMAVERLLQGELVGMPTETVYGLAADSDNEEAVRQVFITKGRPIDNPLIVHVSNPDQARALSPDWNATCDRLAERFWPGPLTLVLVHGGRVNDYVTSGHPTVALRSPAHDTALELIRAAGRPLVAPSANRSGQVSPTTAAHVLDEFPAESFPVLDGGPCSHGIESTVLALSDEIPVVLRPGAVTLAELREELPRVEAPVIGEQLAAPGTSLRHYAPNTPAILVRTDELDEQLAETEVPAVVLSLGFREASLPHQVIEMPERAADYARGLYAALRRADLLGGAVIMIEMPPLTDGLWRAVNDRLRRACVERA